MARSQQTNPPPARGLLARPLDALAFLLPLLIFYEVVSLTRSHKRVIAFDLLRRFFELFGEAGIWAPGVGVAAILIATHIASGHPWAVRWRRVGLMYVEAVALALPLLLLNWAVPLSGGKVGSGFVLDRIAMGIGAGIYEELVFRLVLVSFILMIGVDLLRFDRTGIAVTAVLLSAVAFAAHHHQPFGLEPFNPGAFGFRTIAGMYLAIVFWYRGYGPAAGCHAAYNVALVCIVGSAM